MRVATLFARHGSQKYPNAERRLQQIYETQLSGIEHFTLVIDNALTPDIVHTSDPSFVIIGGDNSAWEFSAWNKGLEHLGEEIWSFDLVHLVTSAFDSLYNVYLERFNEQMLRAIAEQPVCLGHIDCYNEPVSLFSFKSQHWLRSSFLFARPTEVKILRSLISLIEPAALFGVPFETPFAPGAEISLNYERYILDWLTGKDIGQGTTWHSKFALTPGSLSLFQAKATAILNEHLLSIRLRAQATRLIDTTWLAGQLAAHSPASIDWDVNWQNQLAGRSVDPVLVKA